MHASPDNHINSLIVVNFFFLFVRFFAPFRRVDSSVLFWFWYAFVLDPFEIVQILTSHSCASLAVLMMDVLSIPYMYTYVYMIVFEKI